ncbi:Sbal_3080 family lipoprotein [Pontiellaceae bacterium B12227]|nr:Sbal_3080 family lipoprotein [Pontiellaceae bacterium B12227]
MKRTLIAITLVSAFVLTGCTSVKVSPLSAEHEVERVAIKENEQVIVADFLDVIEDQFEEHGITTVVYQNKVPANCQATLSYSALQTWDIATYLSHAEITLRDMEGKRIAHATYHLNGKGGLDLTKWKSVESKMEPVIDELLKEYD